MDSPDNLSSLELIPSEDATSIKKPSRLLARLKQLFCFNRIIYIDHPFPRSMQVLVNFHRGFWFSFSGCLFIERESNSKVSAYQIDERKFSWNNWKYTNIAKRIVMIALNCLVLALFIIPFTDDPWADNVKVNSTDVESESKMDLTEMDLMEWIAKASNQTSNHDNKMFQIEQFGHFVFNIAHGYQNSQETLQLKPILRLIVQWLVYVYVFNAFIVSALNLVFGGAFLRNFLSIRELCLLDRDKSLGIWLVGSSYVAVLAIKLATTWVYQKELIVGVLWPNVEQEGDFETYIKQRIVLINFIVELIFSTGQNVYLSMVSLWFIYSMVMFRRSIDQLQLEARRASELDEMQMSLLKARLFNLNQSFKSVICYFSVPITLDLMANSFMLIGSACFLIINQNRDIQSYAASFIANIGLFALVRLVVVASAGNMATNACNVLVRVIFENKTEWTLQEWLYFLEIKRMPAEFTASIFSVYSVQQSSILSMLGFALQYIVVLLQTENYTSEQGQNVTLANGSVPTQSTNNLLANTNSTI